MRKEVLKELETFQSTTSSYRYWTYVPTSCKSECHAGKRYAKPYEKSGQSNDKMPALKAYGHDLTEMCREGKMDPVIGRKEEVERSDSDSLPPP